MARIDEIKVRLINDINEELGINVDENENLLYSGTDISKCYEHDVILEERRMQYKVLQIIKNANSV